MFPNFSFLTTDGLPFNNICDSSAFHCAFQSHSFFTTTLTQPSTPSSLGGIADGLPIHGVGTATITLSTHASKFIMLHIPNSLYVPDLPCNLISPQWLVQTLQKQNKNSSFHAFPYGCLFLLDDHVVPLPYHPTSNLPVFQLLSPPSDQVSHDPTTDTAMSSPMATHLLHGFEAIHQSLSDTLPFCTTTDEHANLTAAQCHLYDWHVHLGHMNFAMIQSMA